MLHTEAAQILGGEESTQGALRRIGVEQPGRAAAHTRSLRQHVRPRIVIRQQQLGGFQSRQFGQQRVTIGDFTDAETPTRQIGPGQTKAGLATRHRHQQRVATFLQQRFVGDRTRRDDAHHLALDQSLGQRRITNLFADRHRLAECDQPRQIALIGMYRHTRHRNRLPGGAAALGQGDIQQARRLAGVVVEQLVKIAHAEEQQDVRVLRLGGEELLHQRGMFGRRGVRHVGSAVDQHTVYRHGPRGSLLGLPCPR